MTASLSIRDLLARLDEVDESHEVEAKRSESEVGKSALETISAFANEPGLGGGYVLFGVEEKERVFLPKGVANPKKLEQELSTLCAAAFNRTIRPRITTEIVDGAALVAAFIPEAAAAEKPIFLKSKGMQNGAFRRVGSTDQRCTEDDLRVLFQASSVTPYEDTVVADATMADLDEEAIATYRRLLVESNPATELGDASVEELVQSLGGARRVDKVLVPTVAGVFLFGKRLALRRLFPAVRVDYIRVPGVEWVPDPDHRYESIEVREPMLVTFRRVYNAVLDELPKSFALEPGSPERRDKLALPESAVREALVNALTHRDCRVARAVQVIRYQDRIEVRNPGYSLVDDERLGEPGSFPRNPHIADVFREMRLAENKGTGIAAIRKVMRQAGLTPPVFESDRTGNQFIVTLWLHNLIGENDTTWLQEFSAMRLSNEQARALVMARRVGFVSNAMLRDECGLDTLTASNQLKRLRDEGLLEPRGRGSAVHYVLGTRARGAVTNDGDDVQAGPDAHGLFAVSSGQTGEPFGQTGGLSGQGSGQTGGLRTQTGGLPDANGGVANEVDVLLRGISPSLRARVDAVGARPSPSTLRSVIVELCEVRWWTPRELALVLKRKKPAHLSEQHLSALVKEGKLERRYPETLAHPQQAYRARQSSLLESTAPVNDDDAIADDEGEDA